MKTLRTSLLSMLALVLVATTFTATAGASTSKPRNATMLSEQIEASIRQAGLTWGKHYAVSDASCEGQLGQPGPKFHSFWCQVAVPDLLKLQLIHVEVGVAGRWAWTPWFFIQAIQSQGMPPAHG